MPIADFSKQHREDLALTVEAVMRLITKSEFEELVAAMAIHSIRVPNHHTEVRGVLNGEAVVIVYDHVEEEGHIVQNRGAPVRSP